MKLITHLHLMPRSRMVELYLHSVSSWHSVWLIKHRDNFCFTLWIHWILFLLSILFLLLFILSPTFCPSYTPLLPLHLLPSAWLSFLSGIISCWSSFPVSVSFPYLAYSPILKMEAAHSPNTLVTINQTIQYYIQLELCEARICLSTNLCSHVQDRA
jgi:hypothetical protein